jgi:hypothetical protein
MPKRGSLGTPGLDESVSASWSWMDGWMDYYLVHLDLLLPRTTNKTVNTGPGILCHGTCQCHNNSFLQTEYHTSTLTYHPKLPFLTSSSAVTVTQISAWTHIAQFVHAVLVSVIN